MPACFARSSDAKNKDCVKSQFRLHSKQVLVCMLKNQEPAEAYNSCGFIINEPLILSHLSKSIRKKAGLAAPG